MNRQTNEVARLRRKCIDDMIRYIEEDAAAAQERGDLLNSGSKDGKEFFDAMNDVMVWAGKPNLADFLPVSKWLDPQGIKRNMVRDMGRALGIVSNFVKERVDELKLAEEQETKDLLDILLEHTGEGKQGPDSISNQIVIIIILEMFFAGSETTSSTIEWAMAELLRKPDSMKKVKEEINRVIGPQRKVEESDIDNLPSQRKVEESDIDNLPYFQAVIKETLRLHPVIPLLLPRNAMQDTDYMGYFIPKETQIFVNVWAIGRDPETWEDPLAFKPERFLGSKIDYKGQNFELLPFGSGRQICLGISLAHKVVHLGLATLLNSFDWELRNNICPETIDMNERVGITTRKLKPLEAIPKKRVMDAR
ncbi:hypothetical protein CXB51_023468 [Gossypium anomalum]|uniref:Cytochrome P450 n=1 Tax=Gossypium anomalum TaxID=47600 RepID=A0A8J5YW79_9ROSI|nr:hypothetical protein CXB51_023468 [Gossypium anomalum]